MTIPTKLTPANSFSAFRQKFNQVIDELSSANLSVTKQIAFVDDCHTAQHWDDLTQGTGGIFAISSGINKFWSGILQIGTGNNIPALVKMSNDSFGAYMMGITNPWEFHIRFSPSWNFVAGSGSAVTKLQIGLGNGVNPFINQDFSASANNYYLEMIITNNVFTSANLYGAGLTGTTNLTSLYTGYVPDPFGPRYDILSFKFLPSANLEIYYNGVFKASAATSLSLTRVPAAYSSWPDPGGTVLQPGELHIDYVAIKTSEIRPFYTI